MVRSLNKIVNLVKKEKLYCTLKSIIKKVLEKSYTTNNKVLFKKFLEKLLEKFEGQLCTLV